ncbi:DUF397 domain-containing protein [Nonomuraea spiralis]|uniref:DUF397 domain-containing protein n=1 Tax=Nonomuraea spiralis TaxID=46182 RepID=A0ABV5II14_9ACTN|nr:DUF397 domain-containing protein [Nonomuraea spiralis]GGS96004.1 hypothetical protein GCM10010176_044850 [Nonomuraea spiralis]
MTSDRPSVQAAPQWRAASRCNNGECVEVALLSPGRVGVRDNKNPGGPVLTFTTGEWDDFLRVIRQSR